MKYTQEQTTNLLNHSSIKDQDFIAGVLTLKDYLEKNQMIFLSIEQAAYIFLMKYYPRIIELKSIIDVSDLKLFYE